MIEMPKDALQAMLQQAAHDGARAALKEIGLSDENAAKDVLEIRSLLDTYRAVKRATAVAVAKLVATALLGAALLGTGVKIKDWLWPQ